MSRKDKRRNSPPKSFGESIDRQIQNLLESFQPEQIGWEDSLQNLNAAVSNLIGEKEPKLKLRLTENLVKTIRDRYAASWTKKQEIQVKLWLGHNYETLGAWEKALSTFQEVRKLCTSAKFSRQKAEVLRWLGHIYLMKNDLIEAAKAYKSSLNLCMRVGDHEGEANAYNAIGYFHFEKGELDKTSANWTKALSMAENLNEINLTAQIENNLGALSNVRGRREKALAYYAKSIPLFERIGQLRGLAETYHNMAMTYADGERWAEAGIHYEKSHLLAKKIGDVRLQAMVKLNRVELYLAIRDLYLADALCKHALQTFSKLDDHLGQADVFKFLGVIHTFKKEWVTAKAYFGNSIQLSKKYKSPLCEAESHFEYARMLKQKGDMKSARKQYELALKLFRQLQAEEEIEKIKLELSSLLS